MGAPSFNSSVRVDCDGSHTAGFAKTKAPKSPTTVRLNGIPRVMARNSAIPPESFEEILAWLYSDREVAATMYVQLRHDLANIFRWRGCSDPEGLTDEVFDRVAK